MTTWYKEGRGHVGWVAFSVRPDLWPPGTCAWARGVQHLCLADWTARRQEDAVDEANGVPGAAEALILAGQVVHGAVVRVGEAWVEITDPRAKGAP